MCALDHGRPGSKIVSKLWRQIQPASAHGLGRGRANQHLSRQWSNKKLARPLTKPSNLAISCGETSTTSGRKPIGVAMIGSTAYCSTWSGSDLAGLRTATTTASALKDVATICRTDWGKWVDKLPGEDPWEPNANFRRSGLSPDRGSASSGRSGGVMRRIKPSKLPSGLHSSLWLPCPALILVAGNAWRLVPL